MGRLLAVLAGVLCAFVPGIRLHAEIPGARFESERVLVRVTPDQDVVEADFVLHNDGRTPLAVESVLSGCQCLQADAPDVPLEPGAKAVIHGVFKVGSFQGLVEKQMTARLRTSEASRDVVLTVAVEVPEVMKIRPETLEWKTGGELEERFFELEVLWPEPIRLLAVECSREEFRVRWEAVEDGRRYRIHVKPTTLAQPVLGLLQMKTDCRFPKYRNPMAFLSVRPGS